jgi:hypothetical protein
VACVTKIDPGSEHAAVYIECPLPPQSDSFTQGMTLDDVSRKVSEVKELACPMAAPDGYMSFHRP